MSKEAAKRRRRWRTRPSMARVSIVAGDVDFLQHRDSSWLQNESLESRDDPSFHMVEHVFEGKPEPKIVVKKPIKKTIKARPKPKPKRPPSIDESAMRKLNAIFEEVEDYSLIIEKVYEDRYVVPSESQQNFSNNPKPASTSQKNNNDSDDSSSWSLDAKPKSPDTKPKSPEASTSAKFREACPCTKSSGASPSTKFPDAYPSTKSPYPKKMLTTAMHYSSVASNSHLSYQNTPVIRQMEPEVEETALENTFFPAKSTVKISQMSLHLSLSPGLAEKSPEESAGFSTPENSTVDILKAESETPNTESQKLIVKEADENGNETAGKLSLSFRQQEFVASTPIQNLVAGNKVLNNSAMSNIQSPVVAMEKKQKQRSVYGNLIAGSVSCFSTVDVFCGKNVSCNRNVSQVTVDNPLNLFYYLRGFMGTPTDLNYLLYACGQSKVQSWQEFLPTKTCKKLGEGAYGEVFQSTVDGVPVALKILPFMDKQCYHNGLVNGDRMKQSMEILPELLITKELSQLVNEGEEADTLGYSTPGFVRLIQAAICQGNYPLSLLAEWDRFDKLIKSENDRPDTYSSPNQLFMVFALSLGGKDLEAYTIRNEREAFSIFFQVALSLAIAEETLEFEHRDLHIGNVLIAQCRATETIKFVFNGDVINLKSCGATVSIIDFTNSRMQKDGTTIFLDLSKDEELFKGTGDYQFDIYRMMREKNKDEWRDFTPATNVLWLHYLATKLFGAKKIPLKRRKEILSRLDFLLQHDRIKAFLEEESVLEIFQDFVVS